MKRFIRVYGSGSGLVRHPDKIIKQINPQQILSAAVSRQLFQTYQNTAECLCLSLVSHDKKVLLNQSKVTKFVAPTTKNDINALISK